MATEQQENNAQKEAARIEQQLKAEKKADGQDAKKSLNPTGQKK